MKRKDKEKQQPKQKEFAASPFKALKGASLQLQGAAASTPAKKKEEKPAAAAQELSDEMLFFEAVAGIKRLSGTAPVAQVKAQQTAKARRDEEDQEVFLKALEALRLDVRFSDQVQDDEPAPRPGAVNRLRQVRRGGIRIDLQLDLHGLTRDEAVENLERFVRGAYNRGQKGVLVITGKGNNSAGEPVLRVAVANWLREHGKGMVAEFVQAPSDMGGSGAFVVFFKEKKVEPEETESGE
ncbi:Smr/MutS family protein [Geomonas subterranea]|uniref:Smr/MutS family protein n=1 Tax=Geomonas subterranea TaxID=2847989 RepID=A0ABX8LHG4_9BACT|nr:Smr/MutS family protein [Geomonas subterranea]QXE89663.1 Smr/MutS family protein [Geomonas subterranea]QXM08222.1 Smr/MutS family protein [Geomonas subterranea]